jgi:hypothetical protein
MVALAVVAIVAVPPFGKRFCEPAGWALGWALVVNDPVAPADIIVVSLDTDGAGALEAADLVQSGIATRVAVFTDPQSGEDHEFIRRAPLRRCRRKADSPTKVAWRDGCRANPRNRKRWNRR